MLLSSIGFMVNEVYLNECLGLKEFQRKRYQQ
jgi:hypothetical protein